jgi:hypothetical protein
MAKIEATDRSDAVLLGTRRHSSTSGLGTEERYNMRFNLYASELGYIKGPSFVGITEWDAGTFPSCRAEDYQQFVEILTNGQNDTISVRAEFGGSSGTEDNIFVKSPGISVDYPDFHGCIIKDVVLRITNIVIDHSTPGWTYFTWDVTWEIWGLQREPDLNRDGKVCLPDFSIFSSAWDSQEGDANWNQLCDMALPPDNKIDELDLSVFCSKWLYGCYGDFEEDFETGDFSRYPWLHLGNSGWQIVTDTVMEGIYSAKSGSITDSQESTLEIDVDVQGTQITFYKKVSSESNYDYLHFYINDVEQASWSGESDWAEVSFPVTEGVHTFKWSYTKDFIVSTGGDCAWIDQIRIN